MAKEKDFGQSGAAAIDTVRAACNRREILILTTSRVKAEGCFSGMEADCFHAAIDASLDDIRDGLRSSELMVRFPAGDRFLEGPVDLLGLGTRFGRRTVKLAFPTSLSDGDQRGAYRTERVRRIPIHYSAPKCAFTKASMINLSVSGAKIRSQTVLDEGIRLGATVSVIIPLDKDLRIESWATVRYVQDRSFGVEFNPPLTGTHKESVNRWIFMRREEEFEALKSIEKRKSAHMANNIRPGDGITVLSSDFAVGETLKDLLEDIAPVEVHPPTVQGAGSLRDPLARLMVILHAREFDHASRKRARVLLDSIRGDIPVFLLGTGPDTAGLGEMAADIKAAGQHMLDREKPSPLLPKMIQGLWNQTAGKGTAGTAPEVETDESLGEGITIFVDDHAAEGVIRGLVADIAPVHVRPVSVQGVYPLRNPSARAMAIMVVRDQREAAMNEILMLLDAIHQDVPIFLLGVGIDQCKLAELVAEVRAAGSSMLDLAKPSFLLPKLIRATWNQTTVERA